MRFAQAGLAEGGSAQKNWQLVSIWDIRAGMKPEDDTHSVVEYQIKLVHARLCEEVILEEIPC